MFCFVVFFWSLNVFFCVSLRQNALSEELSNMKKIQDDLIANKVFMGVCCCCCCCWS